LHASSPLASPLLPCVAGEHHDVVTGTGRQGGRAIAKSALSRDVKAGRVSASRNADGSLAIEPSELYRVFPPVSHGNGGWSDRQPVSNGAGTAEPVRDNAPQRAIDSLQLRERLVKAEAERDLLLDLVADLRAQRDREAEERRRLISRSSAPRRTTRSCFRCAGPRWMEY
jgi:hypothetical protein